MFFEQNIQSNILLFSWKGEETKLKSIVYKETTFTRFYIYLKKKLFLENTIKMVVSRRAGAVLENWNLDI